MKTAKVRSTVVYGNNHSYDDMDEWKKSANPYTVILRYHRNRITVPFWTGPAWNKEPSTHDVLSCLVLDAWNADTAFEVWCSEFGYDTDSRKAEKIYKECKKMRLKLKTLFGDEFDDFMSKSEEELQDYCV